LGHDPAGQGKIETYVQLLSVFEKTAIYFDKRLIYGENHSAFFEGHLRLCLYMPLEYDFMFSAIIGSSA